MKQSMSTLRWGLVVVVSLGTTQCVTESDTARRSALLTAECTDDAASLPGDAWVCPDALTVECDGGDGTADVPRIYVEPSDAATMCADVTPVVSDEGPFEVGTHDVVVSEESDGSELCSAALTVEDTVAPTLTTRSVELWPPNHRMVHVSVADCVEVDDACDPDSVTVRFTRASSDEPEDDRGDGHTDEDIEFEDCGVELRAERQGGGNGRVYTLELVATDAAGNETTGTCTVTVPHDRSGDAAVDDGESYSVVPDADDLDECDDDGYDDDCDDEHDDGYDDDDCDDDHDTGYDDDDDCDDDHDTGYDDDDDCDDDHHRHDD